MNRTASSHRPHRSPTVGWIALALLLVLVLGGCERTATPPVEPSPTAAPALTEPTSQVPPTAGPSPLPTPTVLSPELAQARDLAVASKIEEAIAIYTSLSGADPQDVRPEIGWAWALIYDDEPGEALVHAQRAVDLDAKSSEAWAVLSRAYAGMGDAAAAMSSALEAAALNIDSPQARAALAEAHLLAKERLQALRAAERALELGPTNSDAHRIRALVYQHVEGQPERGAAELQTAAAYQPQLWLRRHELGRMLLDAGYPSVAALAFEDALRLRSKAVSYAGLGEAEFEQLQYEPAEVALAKAIDLGLKEAWAYGYLAATYAWLGQCDKADPVAQQALALDPGQERALEAGEVCRGTAKAMATPAPEQSPTPAPTRAATSLNGQIAFPLWNSASNSYDVYLAHAKDGAGRTLIVGGMRQPALSPDGQWLAVNGERSGFELLCLLKPDGSGLMEISAYMEDGQPAWSADGKKLVLASFRQGGDRQPRLFVLDDIPWGGGKVEGRPVSTGQDAIRGEMPAWTADGQIVYRACGLDSPKFGCNGQGLSIVSGAPVGVNPVRITDQPGDSRPTVHGKQVAFMSNRDGDWEIYVVNLDASGLKQLTKNGANDGLPAWSPDGSRLAFVSDQGGSWAVWAMSADGSNLRKLFDLGGGLGADWTREQISWGP